MAHPYKQYNESAAGKARAKHLTKGYARGGKAHSDAAQDKKLISKMISAHDRKIEGRAAGGRLDKRARGGALDPIEEDKIRNKTFEPMGERAPAFAGMDAASKGKGFQYPKWREDDGPVRGRASGGRLDKFARGGRAKSRGAKTNIKIAIVAPSGAPPSPPGVEAPSPVPPLGGGPPPMPPMPPMPPRPPMMKRGGKVGMKAGAETGEGRLQKAKAYGLKAKK